MALNDETIRLILDIQQTKDPAELAAKFDTLKAKLSETAQAYDVLERQVGEYAVALGQSDAAMDKQVAAAVEATRAGKFYAEVFEEMAEKARFVEPAIGSVSTAMDNAKGVGGSGGRGILGISFAVQDFTSQLGTRGLAGALGAVQNNIPMILTGLGVGAGLAGTISLVSVGLGAALPLLTSFAAGEKDVADKAEAAAKAIEHQKQAADALAGKPTPDQSETAKGVTEYLGMVGGENVRQAIGTTVAQDAQIGLTPEEYKLMRDYEHAGAGQGGLADALFPNNAIDLKRLYAKRAKAQEERTNAIFSTLPTSRDSREAVRQMARANPGNFKGLKGAGFADELQSFEVEDQQMADAREMVTEDIGTAAHEGGVKRRQAAAARNERRKKVEEAQKKQDASIVQAADEEEKGAKLKESVNEFNRKAVERAHEKQRKDAERAARAADRAMDAVPAAVGRSQKILQDSQDLLRQQAVERELYQRSGGQAGYKNVQEAAKRTMDLMDRGMNAMQALAQAEAEQNQKLQHLAGRMGEIEQQLMRNRNAAPVRMRRGAR